MSLVVLSIQPGAALAGSSFWSSLPCYVRCGWAGGCEGRPLWRLWGERRSGVSVSRWKRWAWRCPDVCCNGSLRAKVLVAACDLRGRIRRLEVGARAPAGRTPRRAADPDRPGAAGGQSPWQLGSRPGSSPRGSWSPDGRCSNTSPPNSHPGRERHRSVLHK